MKNTRFQRALETDVIVRCLREKSDGDIITYEELKEKVGEDVRAPNRCYCNLMSARRILLHEDGIVFDVIPKVGLKRLSKKKCWPL